MPTQSEPGDGPLDPGLGAIMSEQRQLINLAYRLLGSLADAEDVAQETYARWCAMSPQHREVIASPGGWLTKVASRICLDLLGSARARRERYVGEWIPEPLRDGREWTSGRSGGTTIDPADRVTPGNSINMAFLVVLESMTPAQRVAFILHDVFRYSFTEGAEIVGRTPAACRQLASSARRRIRASQPPATPTVKRQPHSKVSVPGVVAAPGQSAYDPMSLGSSPSWGVGLIPSQAPVACRLNCHPHERACQYPHPGDPQYVPESGDHPSEGAAPRDRSRNLDKDGPGDTTTENIPPIDQQ